MRFKALEQDVVVNHATSWWDIKGSK